MKLGEARAICAFTLAVSLSGMALRSFLGDMLVIPVAMGFMIGFVTARTLYYK
jgi:hypothetical protein